jgi:hypothetical protein
VLDFQVGADRLDLSAYTFGSFAGVLAATSDGADGALITLEPGSSIVLVGVPRASLTAADVIL